MIEFSRWCSYSRAGVYLFCVFALLDRLLYRHWLSALLAVLLLCLSSCSTSDSAKIDEVLAEKGWTRERLPYNPGGTLFEDDELLAATYQKNLEKEREKQKETQIKKQARELRNNNATQRHQITEGRTGVNTMGTQQPMVSKDGIDLSALKGAHYIDKEKLKMDSDDVLITDCDDEYMSTPKNALNHGVYLDIEKGTHGQRPSKHTASSKHKKSKVTQSKDECDEILIDTHRKISAKTPPKAMSMMLDDFNQSRQQVRGRKIPKQDDNLSAKIEEPAIKAPGLSKSSNDKALEPLSEQVAHNRHLSHPLPKQRPKSEKPIVVEKYKRIAVAKNRSQDKAVSIYETILGPMTNAKTKPKTDDRKSNNLHRRVTHVRWPPPQVPMQRPA